MKRLLAFFTAALSLIVGVSQLYAAADALPLPAGAPSHIITLRAQPNDFRNISAANVEVSALATRYQVRPKAQWNRALVGFAANLTPEQVTALQNDPAIASVEANGVVRVAVATQTIPNGVKRVGTLSNTVVNVASNGGKVDADVAVIDTGSGPHADLNIFARVNCIGGTCVAGGDDDNGHGTHVAGTIGAIDNNFGVVGVAPGVRIWSVKALNAIGDGTWADVLAGINYVVANAASIEVINMSLSGEGKIGAINRAIRNAVNAGIVVVVAAGNANQDAANYSPANAPDAFTVSAISDYDGLTGGLATPTCNRALDDQKATYSNWGTVIDLAAPGSCIRSTWLGNRYTMLFGTSMAAPHVAGAAALLASRSNPNDRAGTVMIWNKLKNSGHLDWVDTSPDGVQEKLLYIGNSNIFNPVMLP